MCLNGGDSEKSNCLSTCELGGGVIYAENGANSGNK